MITRPDPSEHQPYYGKYIALVPDGDIVRTLAAERDATLALLSATPAEKSLHRYAPGKWSIRECYVHLTDTERIFAYRALRIGRADQTPLAGFEQDNYVGPSEADSRDWAGIVDEYNAVRAATIALYANLPHAAWTRAGNASGNPITVRALSWITAGHDIHHRNLVRERYL
jgi:hypothetical protein